MTVIAAPDRAATEMKHAIDLAVLATWAKAVPSKQDVQCHLVGHQSPVQPADVLASQYSCPVPATAAVDGQLKKVRYNHVSLSF